MSFTEDYKKIEQAKWFLKIASRGMGLDEDSNGFFLVSQNLEIDTLLEPDTFAPVILSLADMLYEESGMEEDFKTFFPVKLEKREKSLCYVEIKPDNNYDIEKSGFSLALASLFTIDVMEKMFEKNPKQQVILDEVIKMWRKELCGYKEGEQIDIRNHKEALINGNLSWSPKIRPDLEINNKTQMRKDIFS